MHGVLLKIFDRGVFITGESGVGKSEIALGLLDRGHTLISDDLVKFTKDADGRIIGQCPTQDLHGYIHQRELGLIDIAAVFSTQALADKVPLGLIIQLASQTKHKPHLTSEVSQQTILDTKIDTITLSFQSHQNAALLIEIAVKNLQMQKNVDNTVPRF